jgi:hypothetical protein
MATLTQTNFLAKLNTSYYNYVNEHVEYRQVNGNKDIIFNEIIISYLRMYVYMLNIYFDIIDLNDTNILTEDEIQIILDRVNHIMDTDLYVDFTITDLIPNNHIWDDTLIWDDDLIWID